MKMGFEMGFEIGKQNLFCVLDWEGDWEAKSILGRGFGVDKGGGIEV